MRQAIAIALIGGASGLAFANHGDSGWHFAPSASYINADDERGTDDGFGFGLRVGRPLSESRTLEFSIDHADLDGTTIWGLNAALLTYLGGSSKFYTIARAGLTSSDGHPGNDYDGVALAGGLGYRVPFIFGDLRFEGTLSADLHGADSASTFGEKLFFIDPSFGLVHQLSFGGHKAASAPADAPVRVVADTDNDGIADDSDLCPDTPAGTTVDSTGCAPSVTPACDGPQIDDAVDSDGCAASNSTLLRDVLFDFDSADLTDEAMAELDDVVALMIDGTGDIEIAGHTSDEGNEFYNLDLSQRRASSVRRYLIDSGIAAGRISARGYGDEAPRSGNDTMSGGRDNRRVEIRALN